MNSFINNSDIDSEKIKFKERFSFGLGDYGTNLTYTLMVTFLAYFYTEVVGVSAILVGSLMFFARVIDGILCVFVGIKIDKTNTKYGKARPWVLFTAIPFGLSAFLMSTIPEASDNVKIWYVCITYLLANILFTANNIAYGSLLALITRSLYERGVLSVFRNGLSTLGSLTVGVFTLPIVGYFGNTKVSWIILFAIFGFFTAVCLIITGLNVRERIKPIKEDNDSNIKFEQVLKAMLKNKYWIMIFFYLFITFTSLTALSTVSVYYSKYILDDVYYMSYISMAQYIPSLLTLLIIPFLLRHLGKRNLALFGLIVCCIACLIPLIDKQNALYIIISTVVRSIGFCGVGATMFAFLADTIDYGEWITKLRIQGILFSAGTLGQTLGMGMGTASIGWILGAFGFISGGDVQQTNEVLSVIEFLFIYFPLILALINIAILCFYKLESIYSEVERDLSNGKFKSEEI